MSRNAAQLEERSVYLLIHGIEWETVAYLKEGVFHCAASLICLRILQHGDCQYLNVPLVKKELRRMSSFSAIYPVCRLPQKFSPVQFWNVLTDENHRAQQCLNQTVWRNVAILSSELSISRLQETCPREMVILLNVKKTRCILSNLRSH